MKKKLLPLACGVGVLVLLLGIYMLSAPRNNDGDSETTTEEATTISLVNTGKFSLCDKKPEELKSVKVTSGENTMELNISEDGYSVKGYEKVSLSPDTTAALAGIFVELYSDNRIDDVDREKFGLAQPLATGVAEYTDGSEVTLTLGSLTADNKYYYLESSEAEGVYLVDAITGGRLLYDIKDVTDKTIAAIKPDYVSYIQVIHNDGKELLMYYDADSSNANKNLGDKGLATLTMEKPLEGATVYPYNLSGSILSKCKDIKLCDVVDPQPEDYSKYGLDNPYMTVRLKDNEAALQLKVGASAGNGYVYVQPDNSISVFTIEEAVVKPFDKYVITDFVEKFVALHTRSQVEKVNLTSEFGDLSLEFKAQGNNVITADEEGKIKDNRLILINGKQYEGDDFKNFYELLAGLSFEQIVEHSPKSGEPEAVLTYTLMDGSVQTTEFYGYNENFYAVGKNSEYDMLVSRQSLKKIVDDGKGR